MYEGKHLYKYLVEFFKKEGLAGATVLRGIDGFGKTSKAHTTSILRLSTDLPIVVEVADTKEKIEAVKPKLDEIITEGLITEEKVKIILYKSNTKEI
jgi:PII-like signaling protein